MIEQLREFSSFITQERKPLNRLSSYIKGKYLLIIKKIMVIRNMEKTLDVMKFWNESNISKIMTIKPEGISEYASISQIFSDFDQIVSLLSERKA